ncbi:MAG TPA: STAS domain-containing protein [Anaerolineae bacterium]|nr:STAS domain-containing protein [Anaerolineae bacterium]
MEITVKQEQGRRPISVIHVKGDIDSNTYQQLQTEIDKSVTAGIHYMLLDLSGVPFMSSAGIRVLNHTFNELRGTLPQESDEAMKKGLRDGTFKSPHLKLLNPSPRVLEVLKMSGVDMFLEIHQDLTEAIASY